MRGTNYVKARIPDLAKAATQAILDEQQRQMREIEENAKLIPGYKLLYVFDQARLEKAAEDALGNFEVYT